jgi:hypothetical protein
MATTSVRCARHSTEWFLTIFCVVVFVFFSASHSKLAPYVLPLMPSLAVLLAPRIAADDRAPTRAAWTSAVLFTALGTGICIFAFHRAGSIATSMMAWAVVAGAVVIVAAIVSSRAASGTGTWMPTALGSILSAQALMMAFACFPPGQSAKPLLADVRSFVGPHTELFSVDQYRQSIPPYLGRTLRLVRYQGEMQFGIAEEDSPDYIPTLDAFAGIWERSSDALAVVDLDAMDSLKARKLPFELRAVDGRSAVITRH